MSKRKIMEMFQNLIEALYERQSIIDKAELEEKAENLYWEMVDIYGNAMTRLEEYNKDYYNFCDNVLITGNDVDKVAKNALYCLSHEALPDKII